MNIVLNKFANEKIISYFLRNEVDYIENYRIYLCKFIFVLTLVIGIGDLGDVGVLLSGLGGGFIEIVSSDVGDIGIGSQ